MQTEKNQQSEFQERAKRSLERDMGASLLTALYDAKTEEIMLNADGRLWIVRLGEQMKLLGTLGSGQAESIIKTVAGYYSKEITSENPILEAELPLDGSRFAAQLPPIVSRPTFAIRKKAIAVFKLREYVTRGLMTQRQFDAITEAIKKHRNILVSGGTASGKTTLVNAIIDGMVDSDPSERLVIIEDTGELQCVAENKVMYHTTMNVSMTHLLKVTLRMRPSRILVGEVRDKCALDLLDAWNTGHPGGAATIHADSAVDALARVKGLVSRNTNPPNDVDSLIGQAVHVIVQISRTPEAGRKIQEVLQVNGYRDGRYDLHALD